MPARSTIAAEIRFGQTSHTARHKQLLFFYQRIGAVIMYAFEILRFDHIPGDIAVKLQAGGNRAHDILNKHGIIIGLFSDEFFVRPLEQGINFIYRA